MFLLQCQILLPQGIHSINHDLDQLDLGVAQAVLVGDVVGAAGLATRLSPGAPGLHLQLLATRLHRRYNYEMNKNLPIL